MRDDAPRWACLVKVSVPPLSLRTTLKILTTALFAVVLLGKRLTFMQWVSLTMLMLGVALIQMPEQSEDDAAEGAPESGWKAFPAALGSSPRLFAASPQTKITALASDSSAWSW